MLMGMSQKTLGGPSSYIRAGRQFAGNSHYQPAGYRGGLGLGQPIQLGGPRMGDTALEWYNRAKTALDQWNNLVARAARIASPAARATLEEWIGHPDMSGTPAYRAMHVGSDFFYDTKPFPEGEGIGAYNVEHRQKRVVKLEDFNSELREMVAKAEQDFGSLPPERPTPPPTTTTTTIIKGADPTVAIAAGAGAIALAVLLSSLL